MSGRVARRRVGVIRYPDGWNLVAEEVKSALGAVTSEAGGTEYPSFAEALAAFHHADLLDREQDRADDAVDRGRP